MPDNGQHMTHPTDSPPLPGQQSWLARLALGLLRLPSLVWMIVWWVGAYNLLDAALSSAVEFQTGLEWATDSLFRSLFWAALLAAVSWVWVHSRRSERKRLAQQAAVTVQTAAATSDDTAAPNSSHCLMMHACWAGLVAVAGMYYLGHAEGSADLGVWGWRLTVLAGIDLLGALGIQLVYLGRQHMWRWGALAAAVGVHTVGLSVGVFLAAWLMPL